METIYSSNDVKIQIQRMNKFEARVKINDKVFICITLDEKEKFVKELQELFEKYRI